MKKAIYILAAALLLSSCNEPFDLNTKTADKTYLCVEAVLTSLPVTQTIRLTESIDYQSDDEVAAVKGARVEVSDGSQTFVFAESEDEPGIYASPRGFACRKGKTYSLKIDCTLSNGESGSYAAVSEMEDDGFDIDKVDYKKVGYQTDSIWVVGVWGKDHPSTNYFLITTAVNGVASPASSLLERSMIMPDTYFNSSYISGFPIGMMYQYAEQMKKYGDCAKPLEEGDVVSLIVYTMTKGYYDFILAMSNASSGVSIPVISSQPANIPTNITGGDAMGYFATCPVMVASCTVDDPMRPNFK